MTMKCWIYLPIRSDFTPFASVALLLIVFFVWAKMVHQPNITNVWDAQGCRKGIEPKRSNRTLEILLVNKDTIQFCHFPTGSVCRANFVTTNQHSTKLQDALFRYREEASAPGELAIVIRPLAESTFGNLAFVLNELRVACNLPYLIAY